MHQYLEAIGFNNIHTRKDLKRVLNNVEKEFTHQTIVSYRPGEDFCEFQKEYGQCMGITVCGELDEEEHTISHITREAGSRPMPISQ